MAPRTPIRFLPAPPGGSCRASGRSLRHGAAALLAWCVLLGVLLPRLSAQDAVLVLQPGPTLSTSAGTGTGGFSGDGNRASLARLASPSGMAYDGSGNLLVADTRNHRVRRIAVDGTITTVAGSGVQGFSGDGGPAAAAQLDTPLGVAVGPAGEIYIADSHNHRVRRVAPDGTIATFAGNGTAGFAGEAGPAVAAALRNPSAVAVGLHGELYIADSGNHRVRRVALDATIQTVAGSGIEDATGDGGPAVNAGLDAPSGVAVRPTDGALLIADRLNSRIRVVGADGVISTLPTGPLRRASGVSADADGSAYIADRGDYQLRAVTASGSGVLLGSGEQGVPDLTAAYNATPLGGPYAAVPDAAGGVSLSDRDNNAVLHLALPQLTFAATVAGQPSPAQNLVLQNSSAAPLQVGGIAITGPFRVQTGGNTCSAPPFTLAPLASCTVAVAFLPTAAGAAAGTLAVSTGGLPQRALLQGTGVVAGTLLGSSTVLRSSGNLSYAGTPVALTAQVLASGTATPTGTVHLLDAATELSQAPLGVGATASFSTTALAVGQHSLSARYDGDATYAGSVSAVQLQTVVAAPDFTLAMSAGNLAVTAGGSGQITLTLQPVNGTLNQPVALTVDNLPGGATQTNNAPTPLVLGSNAVSVVLTVKAAAATAARSKSPGPLLAFGLAVVPLVWRRRLRLAAGALCLIALTALTGCGGGFLGGASVGASSASHSYPIAVTATTTGVTGATLAHTTTFLLVVQ